LAELEEPLADFPAHAQVQGSSFHACPDTGPDRIINDLRPRFSRFEVPCESAGIRGRRRSAHRVHGPRGDPPRPAQSEGA
jgi:hypothetical protein